MAGLFDLKTCSGWEVDKLIPTWNTLDSPNCNQRLIDKNLFETIKSD